MSRTWCKKYPGAREENMSGQSAGQTIAGLTAVEEQKRMQKDMQQKNVGNMGKRDTYSWNRKRQ